MITYKLSQFKRMFFDRKAVTDRLKKAEKDVYSKAGAHVMTAARTSIRYETRKKARSLPGQPPVAHRTVWITKTNKRTGLKKAQLRSPLREWIFFGWDDGTRSCVVGPVLLNHLGGATVLKALEYGGPSFVGAGRGKKRVKKPVLIRARPFMRPALRKTLPKIPQLWRNKLRP